MRICILTFEFNYNYGAVLQAFSLKKVLETYGHEVCIMNRGWDEYIGAEKKHIVRKNIPGYLLGRFYTLKAFHDFKRKYFNLTDPVCNYQDLCNKDLPVAASAILAGAWYLSPICLLLRHLFR